MKIKILISFIILLGLVSCSWFPGGSGNRELENAVGDGESIATALYIHPVADIIRYTVDLSITVNDNIRWAKADLTAGTAYLFETNGTGDPVLSIFSEDDYYDGLAGIGFNGEGEVTNIDGASDGTDAKIIFTPDSSGLYYFEIKLYAGSTWSGTLDYTVN